MISVTLADNFSPILRFFFSFSIMIMHTLGNAFIKTTSVSKNKSVIIVLSLMPTAFFYSPNDVFVFYSFCFSFLLFDLIPFDFVSEITSDSFLLQVRQIWQIGKINFSSACRFRVSLSEFIMSKYGFVSNQNSVFRA